MPRIFLVKDPPPAHCCRVCCYILRDALQSDVQVEILGPTEGSEEGLPGEGKHHHGAGLRQGLGQGHQFAGQKTRKIWQ